MPAIFFALISYFGWGIADVFGTVVARKIGGFSTVFFSYLLFLLLFSVYIPQGLDDLKNMTIGLFIINVTVGIIGMIGDISFYEGLRSGNSPIVGTISGSFAAVTVILSIIFLKENITFLQGIAIVLIFFGIIFTTLDLKNVKKKMFSINKSVILSLVTMVTWGTYYTFIKIPVRELGWFWPIYISIALFPLMLIFMKVRAVPLSIPKSKMVLMPLIFSVIFVGIAEFSFNHAIDKGITAIVAPIGGAYPTLFAVLAFLFFKDPITKQQIVGIITTLIGIILLSIFSV